LFTLRSPKSNVDALLEVVVIGFLPKTLQVTHFLYQNSHVKSSLLISFANTFYIKKQHKSWNARI